MEATRAQRLGVLLKLVDLHLAAAQALGNDAAERIATELAVAPELNASGLSTAAQDRLQASVDTMLDALQAQDRISQTLQLARHMIAAATVAGSDSDKQSDEALMVDLARRSQSVQPELVAEVAKLIERHLGQRSAG